MTIFCKGRRNRRRKKRREYDQTAQGEERKRTDKEYRIVTRNKLVRNARSSVISIKEIGDEFSYAEVLKTAKEKISLKELGIGPTKLRHSANGGVIIEISGTGNEEKADSLRDRFIEVLGTDVIVQRSKIKDQVRIIGFDESIGIEDIRKGIANLGKCNPTEVRVSNIVFMRNRLIMTWVQCPLDAAIRMVQENGKIQLGWSIARLELLKARPIQCHKCWSFGHVRNTYKTEIDRTGLCFKCGIRDHKSYECRNRVSCLVCKDLGMSSDHKIGNYKYGACNGKRSVANENFAN